jgi:uncharacterized repeat protein (TIGR04138 family)
MLSRWNIQRSKDFGHIVFAMVEGGLMQATEEDTIRDFDQGLNFDTAFDVAIPVENVPLENAAADFGQHDNI